MSRPHHRAISFRTLNVRHWDRMVDTWAADGDAQRSGRWAFGRRTWVSVPSIRKITSSASA
ncbi:hypothetical protein [Streptomyces sp. NBC_01003]|uniref:hypothetical protein n=1 Tax=Streptomyces sp. NBC_01003 TaxID=2903714 RepID=UPI003866295E